MVEKGYQISSTCGSTLVIVFIFKGFSTDGEFNSLRSRGRQRPISLVDVIKDAKKVAMGMKAASITKYFKVDKYGM